MLLRNEAAKTQPQLPTPVSRKMVQPGSGCCLFLLAFCVFVGGMIFEVLSVIAEDGSSPVGVDCLRVERACRSVCIMYVGQRLRII